MMSYADPAGGPVERLEKTQLSAALEFCLGKLSLDVRATVVARFLTGESYPVLAAQLGASESALQVRVARALSALRRCMKSKGWDGE